MYFVSLLGGALGDILVTGAGMVHGRGGRDDKSREFTRVNRRNINMFISTGKSLNVNPDLLFNNAIRRLVLVQGANLELSSDIFDKVEKRGANMFTNELLTELKIKFPKAGEWNRAKAKTRRRHR